MKNLKTYNEFVNESNFLDVWPSMPYGDWKTEYDIPKKIQNELYIALQSELRSKTVKVKEDIEDPKTSLIFKEFVAANEMDAFWSWTNRSESTTVAAHELKNGEIVVAVYQAYDRSEPSTTQIWTIEK